jgi:hypothetical protein
MTSVQEITVPSQRESTHSLRPQNSLSQPVPTFQGGWYDIVLEQSSDKTQHPVIQPLADIPVLYSDIAYGAGTSGSKTHQPEFAKIVLSGLPGNCHISVFANGLSKPIGEKRLSRTTACVVFLRELTRVLPAGTVLKLRIAPIY